MNPRALVALAAVAALGAAACGSSTTSSTSGTKTTGRALVEEANTGVTFTQNFNPFDSSSTGVAMNMTSLIYEPLFEFDALNPAEIHPWLGTKYSFDSTGQNLTVTIRSGVKWDNGTALTPQDVAYTFSLIMNNTAANSSGVPTQSAAPTVSGQTVTLHFATAQYTNLNSILGTEPIVPQSQWSSITGPATATVANPIGSGPFKLGSFSTQVMKFTPNKYYWGGTPPESEIDIPYYATNDAASQALVAGTLDWAGNDIANVYQNYVDLNPTTNHAWFAPGNTVSLEFNLAGPNAVPALEDAQVRLAISAGIDRTALSELGESGYENPATSSSGLELPSQAAYLTASQTNDLKPDSNPTAVSTILTGDGYTAPAAGAGSCTSANGAAPPVPANCYTKGGTPIVFAIEDPVPYSDYWEDDQLIVSELNSEGIAAWSKGDNPDTGWYTDMGNGNFQSMIHWGNGGATPFVQLQNWLDSSQPETAGDYGRYTNPAAATALTTLEGTNPDDTAAVTAAVQTLTNIISTEAPIVPLLYGADWNVYSTAHYTGWPDGANPYMDPSPDNPQLPYILMQLKPVAS